MEELKPCPFCGGDARVQKVNAIVGVKFTVCCGNCYCMGHETTYLVNTREKAVEAWNRRADDSYGSRKTIDREELIKAADTIENLIKGDEDGFMGGSEFILWSVLKTEANRIRKALEV